MSHNFKVGDLALVIGFQHDPSNVGSTVELLQFVRPGERAVVPGGETFATDIPVPHWLVTDRFEPEGASLVLPEHLMPLRGDFAPERQKSQEVPA